VALLELAVTDLALIERVRIPLGAGLTVITGETGAGKSLLIDALSLVLGGRADATAVRSGATTARVEAVFESDPELLICVREVSAAGRSLCRIDDETVTVARLAATAGPLVEIHGQHEQQRLLAAAWQRELLDAYGGHTALRQEVAAAVAAWRANAVALAELDMAPAELERRLDLAQHAADEVDAVSPQPGEVAALRARLDTVARAERLERVASSALAHLAGESGGAREQLALALHDLRELARLDPRIEPLSARLAGLDAELEDVAGELRAAMDDTESDVAESAALEARLGAIYALMRKYGDTEEAVLEAGAAANEEVVRLRGLEAMRHRREALAAQLRAAAEAAATALTAARRDAGARLGPAVTALLRGLGFPHGAFEATLETIELDASGADAVAFLLAPNPGEPARPLARIASGGELSRVSLAIEEVLARADATPTLVFDEVDAGIGGRSADPVGRSLWRLARDHQVLCVTHLPQIAAHADRHLDIRKRVDAGRTLTEVRELRGDDRVAELAAMLGGTVAAQAARATAVELLERAAAAHLDEAVAVAAAGT
jgi:DNA repair protein RecN (Recombination protein N)